MVRARGTMAYTILHGKVEGERKVSETMDGLCRGWD